MTAREAAEGLRDAFKGAVEEWHGWPAIHAALVVLDAQAERERRGVPSMIEIDELVGPALDEAQQFVAAFRMPMAQWPAGTTIEERRNDHLDRSPQEGPSGISGISRFHTVTLPSGGQIITLTTPGRRDDRNMLDTEQPWANGTAPDVVCGIYVNTDTGEVFAHPRVCNMQIRASRDREDPRNRDWGWILDEIGLERRYLIGKLSRPLREKQRIVTDGWIYR